MAGLVRNGEADLESVRGEKRRYEAVLFLRTFDAPSFEVEDIPRRVAAGLALHGASEQVRDRHDNSFRLLQRKLHGDGLAGVIEELQTDIGSIVRYPAACQLLATNLHHTDHPSRPARLRDRRYIHVNIAFGYKVKQ